MVNLLIMPSPYGRGLGSYAAIRSSVRLSHSLGGCTIYQLPSVSGGYRSAARHHT